MARTRDMEKANLGLRRAAGIGIGPAVKKVRPASEEAVKTNSETSRRLKSTAHGVSRGPSRASHDLNIGHLQTQWDLEQQNTKNGVRGASRSVGEAREAVKPASYQAARTNSSLKKVGDTIAKKGVGEYVNRKGYSYPYTPTTPFDRAIYREQTKKHNRDVATPRTIRSAGETAGNFAGVIKRDMQNAKRGMKKR